jgi:predicted nucleotidyltransferase
VEDKMDIMGKKVVHKHLGEGIISDYKVKNGVSYIVVDFSEDNHKEFLFPDIFKDFVKAKDEDFEEYAKELLEQKQKRDKEKEDAIKLQRKKEQKNLIRDEIISNKGRTPKRKNKINSTKKTSN